MWYIISILALVIAAGSLFAMRFRDDGVIQAARRHKEKLARARFSRPPTEEGETAVPARSRKGDLRRFGRR